MKFNKYLNEESNEKKRVLSKVLKFEKDYKKAINNLNQLMKEVFKAADPDEVDKDSIEEINDWLDDAEKNFSAIIDELKIMMK